MKFALIGAIDNIGREIAHQPLQRDHQVTSLVRSTAKAPPTSRMSLSLLSAGRALALGLGLSLAACGGSSHDADAPAADAAPEPATAPLSAQLYNPGADGIFAVSSVLVSGATDAVLVDAQFSAADARKLVELVKASGKRLTTIYISCGDPDYYFGLDTLAQAFADAKIVASAPVIEHIRQTKDAKLKVWGPQLGDNAPKRLIVPTPLDGDTLQLEGQALRIVGLDGPTPDRSVVWVPSIKTVLGGIPVVAGEHVWMADTQTPESHAHWLETLRRIEALQPARVIPGHFAPGAPQDLAAVRFTADYIRAFDEETAKATDAAALTAAMKRRYPGLAGEQSLELSAKVAKGEMQWP
ncbi:MBL fold metallo-hydrolase [Sorangium sp. So ce1151]